MTIVLEREKLYEEVWSIKMKELAIKYGLSEATLRKHCRSLNVPIPQSGFWMKVRNGSNPKKIPLPKFDGRGKVIIQKNELRKNSSYKIEDRLKHMIDKDKNNVLSVCEKIEVGERLHKPHYLIKECKIYRNDRDMLSDGRANNVNIKVSKENQNRALRIFDVILKTVEGLRYKIKSGHKYTKVCINGEEVKIGLKEKLIRTNHIKSNNESYWSPTYDYKYSGELSLFIDEYRAPKKNWRDLENKKIEEMIGDFIITIIDTAEIYRVISERRNLEAEEQRKKEIERMKRKKRQEYELEKLNELKEYAENYRASKLIDEYILGLEEIVINIEDNNKKDRVLKYIDWAKKKSDWLNPIKQKNDEILEEKYSENLYDIDFKDDDNYW
ncbi:hypothetical protein [Clostridium amazonitimonense]|uniref:hypothetical protein n=1 Tax=Clostridium amazonitimonense TaxID=1499689 RepID=UPI0011C7F8F2|nr:hypothetical protein [Clostridium amazonitimonense]